MHRINTMTLYITIKPRPSVRKRSFFTTTIWTSWVDSRFRTKVVLRLLNLPMAGNLFERQLTICENSMGDAVMKLSRMTARLYVASWWAIKCRSMGPSISLSVDGTMKQLPGLSRRHQLTNKRESIISKSRCKHTLEHFWKSPLSCGTVCDHGRQQ